MIWNGNDKKELWYDFTCYSMKNRVVTAGKRDGQDFLAMPGIGHIASISGRWAWSRDSKGMDGMDGKARMVGHMLLPQMWLCGSTADTAHVTGHFSVTVGQYFSDPCDPKARLRPRLIALCIFYRFYQCSGQFFMHQLLYIYTNRKGYYCCNF